jgi:hypothetical protein
MRQQKGQPPSMSSRATDKPDGIGIAQQSKKQKKATRPTVTDDGRWLSARGPYQDFIAKCCSLNPFLRKPDPRNYLIEARTSRVSAVEFDNAQNAHRVDFDDAERLGEYLQVQDGKPVCSRRLFILEGLDPNFVQVLGSYFAVDPSVILVQERYPRINLWDRNHDGVVNPTVLPSDVRSNAHFNICYPELRFFGDDLKYFRTVCLVTGRPILSIGLEGGPDPVGTVCRRCAFWSRKTDAGWECKNFSFHSFYVGFVRTMSGSVMDPSHLYVASDISCAPLIPSTCLWTALPMNACFFHNRPERASFVDRIF